LLTGAIVRANTYVDPVPGVTIFDHPAPSLSSNGRYVSFATIGALVTDDTNGIGDIYVRDLRSGSLVRASTATDGSQSGPNGGSFGTFVTDPDISDDGRWVVFTGNASGLAPGGMLFRWDVFVKDLQTGTLTRVSERADGTPANNFSGDGAISGDGRYVAFGSAATNLVAGDTNDSFDIFIRDMQTGELTRVNVAADGTQTRGFGSDASLSADGQVVAFYHPDANLVSGDTNRESDVFVVRWGLSDAHDTIQTSLPSFTLPQGVEDLQLAAGAVSATGNAFGNIITGNGLNNVLDGRQGNDILFGEGGDDSLSGGGDDDMIMGESGIASLLGGNDVLRGEGGNDMLDGGAGVDVIYGREGNDLIHGDEGSDCVMPGAGVDFMLGSAASAYGPATAGGDLFVYTQMADAGDRIWGFDLTPALGDNDGIDLRPLFDALGYAGANPRSDGFLRVMPSDNVADTLVQIDADGAGIVHGYITLLTLIGVNAASLTDSYFLFH
jgi:Ca2+-binding RTX toxin-like protein